MAYSSLSAFVEELEKNNELIRVKEFVNPELEIAEITDRISKSPGGGKAILFENTGTQFPVLMNMMGSDKRICMALNRKTLDEFEQEFTEIFKDLSEPKTDFFDKLKVLHTINKMSSWMPVKRKGKGICQEVIMHDPDLSTIPVLKCWPEDGGRFVTFPMVNTINPETGIRNVGMYRMQIFENSLTGMHWHLHKTGASHFNGYKKMGKKMPISVAIGGDPANTYAATAPLPDNVDEYLLSGFIRKKKVELVKSITNDIYVPADADFIIEGYVDPEDEFIWEGPFGDHTGFYSLADWYPKFHVTCITHKKNAIYPATIVGIPPMEDAYIAAATEKIFLMPIRMTVVPEILDLHIPYAGVGHNITLVKIKKSYPGQAVKVMHSLWGAGQMMFNKFLIVVDEEVNVTNYEMVFKAIMENTIPGIDTISSIGPMDVLDHASLKKAYGGKFGIDATKALNEEQVTTNAIPMDFDSLQKYIDTKIEIYYSNINLFEKGFPILILATSLTTRDQALKDLCKFGVKWLILIDNDVDVMDMNLIAWVVGNNVEPKRDILLDESGLILIDGRSKLKDNEKYMRDWPNIIVSDDKTIEAVDRKWEKLGLGDFIPSPSKKYKPLYRAGGAVVNK